METVSQVHHWKRPHYSLHRTLLESVPATTASAVLLQTSTSPPCLLTVTSVTTAGSCHPQYHSRDVTQGFSGALYLSLTLDVRTLHSLRNPGLPVSQGVGRASLEFSKIYRQCAVERRSSTSGDWASGDVPPRIGGAPARGGGVKVNMASTPGHVPLVSHADTAI